MKQYIGIVEPTNRYVLWVYPLNNGGFEIRVWGAQGWKSLSSGTNSDEEINKINEILESMS